MYTFGVRLYVVAHLERRSHCGILGRSCGSDGKCLPMFGPVHKVKQKKGGSGQVRCIFQIGFWCVWCTTMQWGRSQHSNSFTMSRPFGTWLLHCLIYRWNNSPGRFCFDHIFSQVFRLEFVILLTHCLHMHRGLYRFILGVFLSRKCAINKLWSKGPKHTFGQVSPPILGVGNWVPPPLPPPRFPRCGMLLFDHMGKNSNPGNS